MGVFNAFSVSGRTFLSGVATLCSDPFQMVSAYMKIHSNKEYSVVFIDE